MQNCVQTNRGVFNCNVHSAATWFLHYPSSCVRSDVLLHAANTAATRLRLMAQVHGRILALQTPCSLQLPAAVGHSAARVADGAARVVVNEAPTGAHVVVYEVLTGAHVVVCDRRGWCRRRRGRRACITPEQSR